MIRIFIFAFLHSLLFRISLSKKITVCSVEELSGMTAVGLNGELIPFPPTTKYPILIKGVNLASQWSPNIGGFLAELLPKIMNLAQLQDYDLIIYKSFNEVLHRTSITGECDIGFATFTITSSRTYCLNVTSATGVPACLKTDKNQGCCATFGVPFMPETIGLVSDAIVGIVVVS